MNYELDDYESEFCASWIDDTDAFGRNFSDADNGL